jgi:single-stranded DNA-binding protein
VEGRLKLDEWETADGRRSKHTVVAENFEFVGPTSTQGGGGGGGGGRGRGSRRSCGSDRAGSQGGPSQQGGQPAAEQSPEGGYDVSDDEIPF